MARRPHPSDLTDALWAILAPLIPSACRGGEQSVGKWPRIVSGWLLRLAFALLLTLAGLALPAPAVHAAPFTVTNLNDSGAGSLRAAINQANANPGANTIAF